jgi:tetratricopeptide (TPR) repeat protein
MSEARTEYKVGFDHFVEGRVDEAIAAYRRSVELDPALAIAWNGLAMALAQREDLDGAIEAAKQLIALEPDEALGHTSLSIFYQRKGMIPEAEDEKAIAMQLSMRQQS